MTLPFTMPKNQQTICHLPMAHAIIPARYASTRFPGKPLVQLEGKPMFWHVWQQVRKCPHVKSVTLATDSQEIASAAESLGVPYVMTSETHASGTDRVHEAATILGLSGDNVIINVQGDEPTLNPAAITELLHAFIDPEVCVATLAHTITQEQATHPDRVKVAMAANGNALYFSRLPIPYVREPGQPVSYLGHIGLYAFTVAALTRFVQLPPSFLEQTEKLEQLRLLENNIPIRIVQTMAASQGVDTPEDVELILPQLRKNMAEYLS